MSLCNRVSSISAVGLPGIGIVLLGLNLADYVGRIAVSLFSIVLGVRLVGALLLLIGSHAMRSRLARLQKDSYQPGVPEEMCSR